MANTKAPALVIMAAGMGSRFGGLKQITPVGPNGELLLDFSVYDALRAGFGRVVFVIKKEIEKDFKEVVGDRISKHVPVSYVYQELDALPEGFSVPEGRTKPWGTGHAVLCCRDTLNEPFAVINADDYYGRQCFEILAKELAKTDVNDRPLSIVMAGYVLKNTLTENGYVSRGVCTADETGKLSHLVERTHIELRDGVPAFTEDDGATWEELAEDTIVSMNCWGFPEGTLDYFGEKFCAFLEEKGQMLKSEFYLPSAVNLMREAGEATVQVLTTPDKWYGMTYAEDREAVRAALAAMTDEGFYPNGLWK